MKKLKNSLELPIPTRNTRKFANKLMNDTSGEINLQSKQDIICHVAKVKPTMSAHSVTDAIPFLAYIIYSLGIQRFDKARKMSYIHSKEKVITRTSTFIYLSCLQAVLVDSLMTVDTQSTDQSVAQQLATTTHEPFTPCSRLHHKL